MSDDTLVFVSIVVDLKKLANKIVNDLMIPAWLLRQQRMADSIETTMGFQTIYERLQRGIIGLIYNDGIRMKKLLVLILFFSMTYVQAQPLMLSCKKTLVKAEPSRNMLSIQEFLLTDRLNYQKGWITDIIWIFEKVFHGVKYVHLPQLECLKHRNRIIDKKKTLTGCYPLKMMGGYLTTFICLIQPVMVRRTYEGALVTFKYAFDY